MNARKQHFRTEILSHIIISVILRAFTLESCGNNFSPFPFPVPVPVKKFSVPVPVFPFPRKIFLFPFPCSRSRVPVPEKISLFPFPYSRSRKFSKWIIFFRFMGKVSSLMIGFGRHHTLHNL
jgi:hypothetical protein